MNTETGRRASAKYHSDRKAAGWRKVTVWLSPDVATEAEKRSMTASAFVTIAVRHYLRSLSEGRVTLEVAGNKTIKMSGARRDAPSATTSVQIGPARPKPGSRLKVKK